MARILVVDDEPNIRKMIGMALEQNGHTLGEAADGPEGLEEFGDGSDWDLVLLDQRLPGLEGLEVLRAMRTRDPNAHIVLITAYGTIDLAVDAMKSGATDFLRKPFSLETLRSAVDAATVSPAGRFIGEGTIISFMTLNGFSIESHHHPPLREDGDLVFHHTVLSPAGRAMECTVILPPYIVELVKAHTGCERMPGGDAFWRGFSEEALANYVWQNAEPPGEPLRVEAFTTGLRHWTDAVLMTRG